MLEEVIVRGHRSRSSFEVIVFCTQVKPIQKGSRPDVIANIAGQF